MKKLVTSFLSVCMLVFLVTILAACNAGNGSTTELTEGSKNPPTQEPPIEGLKPGEFEFELNSDGNSYTITDFGKTKGEIIIPEKHQNLPVTAIGNNVFSGSTAITKIVIPDSVKTIGHNAFKDCTALLEIMLGGGVESIGASAFANCFSLTEITLPQGLTSIGEGAFENCYCLIQIKNLSSIKLTCGYNNNGHVAYYAENIYTNDIGESKLQKKDNCIFYVDESTDTYYLIKYIGSETNVVTPEGVENKPYTVRNFAFAAAKVTSVEIAGGATKIDSNAFVGCSRMESVLIGDSVTHLSKNAFTSCGKLKNVTIGKNVSVLESPTFYDCDSIETIYFHAKNAVNTYEVDDGNYIFSNPQGCDTVISIKIGAEVIRIPENWFFGHNVGSIQFDSQSVCESIGNGAFSNHKKITTLELPDSVTMVGDFAFNNCEGLVSVKMNGVTSIRTGAFSNCKALKTVSAKNAVRISRLGFSGCGSLTDIDLGSQLTEIGESAFQNCVALKLTLPATVTNIGGSAFENCTSLANLVFPEGLTTIGDYAFTGCTSITNVELPNTVTYLGQSAFAGCTSLKSVRLGNQVAAIHSRTFANCTSLESIYFGTSVTRIGKDIFYGCDTLDIYYDGLSSQWGQIEGFRSVFHRIHCADTTIDRS